MLGKVSWWDKEGGVGTVTDIDGKEWNISDDMIDADELKAKMKNGLLVNFDTSPALDNSAMKVGIASPDDEEKFKAVKLHEAEELDRAGIKNKAPHDLQPFVELILDYSAKTVEAVKETLDDDDTLHEIADSDVDLYTNKLLTWYADDANRLEYANQAIEEGFVDPKKGMESIMQAGQYLYNTVEIENARQWLKDYFGEEKEETKEEGAEIGGLVSR